jgi:YD repeat-containing protein
MVAIVSGNGLGLFNTSLTNLGFGLGGSSTFGSARTNQYVNIATGNLMLRDADEFLTVRGFDASFLRTYNLRGITNDSTSASYVGQDGFVTGFERRVVLGTGTFNTANSTMYLRTGDGQTQTFTWSSAGTYIATDGDGANDTLTWNGTARTWTYVEGSSRREELYADHVGTTAGRLTRIRNLLTDGTTPAQYDIVYDANNRISEVRSIDGNGLNADALVFTYWSVGSIKAIQTREAGVLKSQVSYGYEGTIDGSGRLLYVEQDLTPDVLTDNTWSATPSLNNGKLFRTTYAYASATATDLRLSSVTQSDGTVCSYTYVADGTTWRVASVTLGSGVDTETVSFDYAPAGRTNTTKVTDGLGRIWYYKYDAKQRLVEVEAPPVDGQIDITYYTYYNYDSAVAGSVLSKDGQLLQVLTKRGSTVVSQTDYEYDTFGNATWEWHRLGTGANTSATAIQRGYTGLQQLSWERRYSDIDTDGAVGGSLSGYQPSTTGSEYTQYI